MSLELTPEGAKAYKILAWATADKARLPEARQQMAGLARDLPAGQALTEVRDAGRILRGLTPAPPEIPLAP